MVAIVIRKPVTVFQSVRNTSNWIERSKIRGSGRYEKKKKKKEKKGWGAGRIERWSENSLGIQTAKSAYPYGNKSDFADRDSARFVDLQGIFAKWLLSRIFRPLENHHLIWAELSNASKVFSSGRANRPIHRTSLNFRWKYRFRSRGSLKCDFEQGGRFLSRPVRVEIARSTSAFYCADLAVSR